MEAEVGSWMHVTWSGCLQILRQVVRRLGEADEDKDEGKRSCLKE